MKNYELNTKNSKKTIIGISILFCIVILIIGGTFAFFTQSDSETTDNIATVDINKTLKYYDNNDYMRGNLIPVVEEDVIKFASKNELNNYTNDNICKYQDDMYACSLYQFTIENIADVTQKIIVTLNPYPNTFTNLHYLILEEEQLNLIPDSKSLNIGTPIEGLNSSQMLNEVIIKPKESKTYTVIFYIKAMGYDQTSEDANKNFGAIINVNSITTGYNIANIVGESCYDFTELPDKTYKLTKFNGINHKTGEITEGCGVTKNKDTGLYSVEIPSKIGDYNISTLGNTLFSAVNTLEDGTITGTNQFINIEKLTIEEGITTIEDGIYDIDKKKGNGTFFGIGADLVTQKPNPDRILEVNMPNSLKHIGDVAFSTTAIREIEIPDSVETVGIAAFYNNFSLTYLNFKKDISGNTKLSTIGEYAFQDNSISTLTIPNSVMFIGDYVFFRNKNLISLTFEEGSQLKEIGDYVFYGNNINSVVIPSSVQIIGDSAFAYNYNLTKVIFEDSQDKSSKLRYIGEHSFTGCDLTYDGTSDDEYLQLPASIEEIGDYAFEESFGNSRLDYIRFKGSREQLDLLGTEWYSSAIVKAWGE